MKEHLTTIEDALSLADQAYRSGNMLDEFIAVKKLAELEYTPSYEVLGSFYELGEQPEGRRLDLAYKWYSKSAFEGQAAAGYFALGRLFFNGIYVEKDISHALDLLQIAFAKGSIEAGITLGYCYIHGIQVPRDLNLAEKYIMPASIFGYVAATALLAKIAFLRKRFMKGMQLYFKSILNGIKLSRGNPDSPKLLWLKRA